MKLLLVCLACVVCYSYATVQYESVEAVMGFSQELPDREVTAADETDQITHLMASLIRGRIFDGDAQPHHQQHHKKHETKRRHHRRQAAELSAPVYMSYTGEIDYPGVYTFVTNVPERCPSYTGTLPKFNIKVQIGEPFQFNGMAGWNPNIIIVDFPEDRKSYFLTRYNRAFIQEGESAVKKLNNRYHAQIAGKELTIVLEESTGFLNLTVADMLSVAIKGRLEQQVQLAEMKVQLQSWAAPGICGIAKVVEPGGSVAPMEGSINEWVERKSGRIGPKKGAAWANKWQSDPMLSGSQSASGQSQPQQPLVAPVPADLPGADELSL